MSSTRASEAGPSLKRTARLAGACYLVVAIFGGFAELFVRARVYVPGDAVATTEAFQVNVGLVRIGIAADLIQAVVFLALAMLMYRVLRHVNAQIAVTMVVLVAISAGIITLNMVFQQGALIVATDASYATGFAGAVMPGAVAELSMMLYLLVIGIRGGPSGGRVGQ